MDRPTHFVLGARDAERLGARAIDLGARAEALAQFADADPDLAQGAGVEVSALEAKSILAGGFIDRVVATSLGSARSGRHASLAASDFQAVTRLETLLESSDRRIAARLAAYDAQEARSGIEGIGSVIGLATGAVGLLRSIF